VTWVNSVIQGLLLGGQYALIACGLSLTFGVMRIVNLAHGDLAVCGAYLGLVLSEALGVPVWVTLPLLLPAAFVAGLLLQTLLFGRALRHGVLAPVLVTFGLSVMIENLLQEAATSDPRAERRVTGLGQLQDNQRHHRVLAVPDRVPDRLRGPVRTPAAVVPHGAGRWAR
jgi:branched-subunit amino acid ABC-type transport system permease component